MSAQFCFPVLFVSLLACGGASVVKPSAPTSLPEEVSISSEPTSTSDNATPTADATKAYPIHLHRNGHVGERSRVVLDMTEDDVMSFHLASRSREVAHKHLIKHLHLEGEWTTTALDDHQDELHATVDVTKLTEDDAVLLQGKRIDITKAPKKDDATLTVDGKPVSAKIHKAVDALFSLRIDSARSDDIILGTTHPQSVGAHWPINGDRARDDLMNNAGVSSTAVSGEATLVGIERIGGVDVLRIKADLQIDGMVYPLHHPGASCEPTQGNAVVTMLYPVDENHGALETHTSFAVKARIHVPGPRGVSVTGDVDSAAQHDAYVTPL